MKRFFQALTVCIFGTCFSSAQCTASYSYSGTTDTITFTNYSTLTNEHYYWNFGDGSGSNTISPVHIFPDDGKYLVTLYAQDTVSNCVSISENWINVVKPDSFSCSVLFTDTVIGSVLSLSNLSTNCAGVNLNCNVAGPAQNFCSPAGLGGWCSSLFLHGMQAYTIDSIYGYRILKGYYKTVPYQYNSSANYQDCSANFELTISYQATDALVTFTAMNKSATNYEFYVTGFGNPVLINGPSATYLFPYISYAKEFPWNVYLITNDTINNCSDSVNQQILIRNPNYTFPASCEIITQPQNQLSIIGSMAQISISGSTTASYQWQQDAGLGFVNLTNAGPYSGVHTNILSISNVQLTMDNYHYRCVLFDSLGGCHNTSSEAILSVSVGFDEIELQGFEIFPNPATDHLSIANYGSNSNATISIYNLIGEKIFTQKMNGQTMIIELSNLAEGFYLAEVKIGNKTAKKKFVKLTK